MDLCPFAAKAATKDILNVRSEAYAQEKTGHRKILHLSIDSSGHRLSDRAPASELRKPRGRHHGGAVRVHAEHGLRHRPGRDRGRVGIHGPHRVRRRRGHAGERRRHRGLRLLRRLLREPAAEAGGDPLQDSGLPQDGDPEQHQGRQPGALRHHREHDGQSVQVAGEPRQLRKPADRGAAAGDRHGQPPGVPAPEQARGREAEQALRRGNHPPEQHPVLAQGGEGGPERRDLLLHGRLRGRAVLRDPALHHRCGRKHRARRRQPGQHIGREGNCGLPHREPEPVVRDPRHRRKDLEPGGGPALHPAA